MSIGEYIDLIINGLMLSATVGNGLLLGILAFIIGFTRWWYNHYNFTRATIYAKSAVTFVIGIVIVISIAVANQPNNIISWYIIGVLIWSILFVTLAYYIAAAFTVSSGMQSYEVKQKLADFLRVYVLKLEASAKQSMPVYSIPTPAEKQKETMELVKEVIVEHVNRMAML